MNTLMVAGGEMSSMASASELENFAVDPQVNPDVSLEASTGRRDEEAPQIDSGEEEEDDGSSVSTFDTLTDSDSSSRVGTTRRNQWPESFCCPITQEVRQQSTIESFLSLRPLPEPPTPFPTVSDGSRCFCSR